MDFGLPINILMWTPVKLSVLGWAWGCSRQGGAAPLLLHFWLGKGSWGVLGHPALVQSCSSAGQEGDMPAGQAPSFPITGGVFQIVTANWDHITLNAHPLPHG